MVSKAQFQVMWCLVVLSLIGAGLGAVGAVLGYIHQRDLCHVVSIFIDPSHPPTTDRGRFQAEQLQRYLHNDC